MPVSVSSPLEDDFMLFPMTDVEHFSSDSSPDSDGGDADDESAGARLKVVAPFFKPTMTLKQRRRLKLSGVKCQSAVVASMCSTRLERSDSGYGASVPDITVVKPSLSTSRWLNAIARVKRLTDPWQTHHIEECPMEICRRHRYHALRKKWVVDSVSVKMQTESFNHGAMRTCFRLKKLSSFAKSSNWKCAHNYVAKCYIESVDKQVYFEDVKLQMDAKLWGEEFDRHNPPKKVDIFQMSILEFVDRPDQPLYHLEHFIEGEYIKYNSNSGFVDDHMRQTPQAFSHFTFEQSGHRLLVVDIQGVGDLWTDPQIHTQDGLAYGDGNLGTRGMALFFQTHNCNSICKSLGLSPFDLTQRESDHISPKVKFTKVKSTTVIRGNEMCLSPTSEFHFRPLVSNICDARKQRERSLSSMSELSEDSSVYNASDDVQIFRMDDAPNIMSRSMPPISYESSGSERVTGRGQRSQSHEDSIDSDTSHGNEYYHYGGSFSDKLSLDEDERTKFQNTTAVLSRPSCVEHELDLIKLENSFNSINNNSESHVHSILGLVHHDLAKYHELGRFANETTTAFATEEAAIFHERHAADLGVKEAIVTMAKLALNLPRDILVDYTLPDTDLVKNEGVNYMLKAAQAGDRQAMLYMANAYQCEDRLGTLSNGSYRERSNKEAVFWYNKAVNMTSHDLAGEFDATMDYPVYELEACLGKLYFTGGHHLDADYSSSGDFYTSAADNAMLMMKGRLANKYYSLAEESYSLVEE